MAAHPGRTLKLAGKKALLLVNGREGRNNINPRWLAEKDGVFLLARWWPATWLILPAALLGLGLFRRWRPGGGLLFWVVVMQAAAVLPFFVNARFRMPLVPLLALFAVAAVAVLFEQWSGGRRRALGLNLAILAALFLVVNVDWFGLGAERWLARDWFNQGLIHGRGYGDRRPDFVESERCFRRAVELDPAEVDFHERLGAHYLMLVMQRMGSARMARDEEDWPRAAEYLGEAEEILAEARGSHRRATEIMPRSYNSWVNLANAENWLGDVASSRAGMALARADSASARTSALAALEFYQYSVQYYQQSLEVNPQLEGSKRSINAVFRSVMDLPGLDPAIVDFQQRAAAARNRNQRR